MWCQAPGANFSRTVRVDRRLVGDDLDRGERGGGQRLAEESAGGCQIPLLGDQHVDDMPELVDRAVQVDRPPSDLDVGFVDEPAISRSVPAGPGYVDEQWREPLNPLEHGHVIDGDAALCQQLLDIPVRERIAQVPLTATVIISGGNRNPRSWSWAVVSGPRDGASAQPARVELIHQRNGANQNLSFQLRCAERLDSVNILSLLPCCHKLLNRLAQ